MATGASVRPLSTRLLCLVLAWTSGTAWADSRPDTRLPSADAPVEAMLVTDGRLIVAGAFSQLVAPSVTVSRQGLASLLPQTGVVDPGWIPTSASDAIVAIMALALSPDGQILYVGGDFTQIGSQTRRHLAAIDMQTGQVLPWDPGASGPVRALVVSGDGEVVFAGGDFTAAAGTTGGAAHDHLVAIDAGTGQAIPWRVDADGAVLDLALSADDGVLYAVGRFGRIGGQLRSRVAAIDIAAAAAKPGWRVDADAPVRVVERSIDGATLYLGGDFIQISGQARQHLAAIATADGSLRSWAPSVDGPVTALDTSADGQVVYIAGGFSLVGGQPRSGLAALSLSTGVPLAWDPSGQGNTATRFASLAVDGAGRWLYVGGDFSRLGGVTVGDLAVFAVAPPETSATPPPGAYQAVQSVSLSCLDNRGQACPEIRYSFDGGTPAIVYTAPIVLSAARTLLRYFGVGGEGLQGSIEGGEYFVDTSAPTTGNDLAPGSYGIDGLRSVALSCRDETDGSGCAATYFTLDDSPPRERAQDLYRRPIDLTTQLDLIGSQAGQVVLRYFSIDRAGNREVEHRDVYVLDQSPPVISADPPQGNYRRPLTITLSCSDESGPCGPIFYTLDGSQPSDGSVVGSDGKVLPATLRYDGAIVLQSGATLEVMARDQAGNIQSGLIGIYSLTQPVSSGGKGTGGLGGWPLLGLLPFLASRRRRREAGA